MHQTVIISIMIMRPRPHIRSKEHLGVIRCKALQEKNAFYGGIPIRLSRYYTWLHMTVVFSPSLSRAGLRFSVASRPVPSLLLSH